MLSNASENTSLVPDRPRICFVDGFEFQKVAVSVQLLSVHRISEGGSGSSNCKSEVTHIICLESSVCQVALVKINAFNSCISKIGL